MSTTGSAEASLFTEQEKSHWRFVGQGLNWTALGVILMAVSMALLLILVISMMTITAPLVPGGQRGGFGNREPLSVILSLASAACTSLGFLAALVGLALCCFAPRPMIARFLALGSLLMLVLSHSSIGRSILTQVNMNTYGLPMQSSFGVEMFSLYFTAFAEYLLSIILGCCYLMAVASDYHDRETVRGAQSYLKLLFGVPVVFILLGIVITVIAASFRQSAYWIPLVVVAFVTVAYCWMAFMLVKLLFRMNQTIRSKTDPFYRPPNHPAQPKPVIDPLAD